MAKVMKLLVLIVALAFGTATIAMLPASDKFSAAQAVDDGGCESCTKAVSHDETLCTPSCHSSHFFLTRFSENFIAGSTASEMLLPSKFAALASWQSPIDPRPPRG